MAIDAFKDETQKKPIIRRLNELLKENGYEGGGDVFWESQEDRYVSRDSLLRGADIVELHLTREQWQAILGDASI